MRLADFGGAMLKWPEDKAEDRGLRVWDVAEKDSQWFRPIKSSFMINHRVDNLGEFWSSCVRAVWQSYKDPNRTRTASLRGSWTPTETRSSSGSRRSGTIGTKVPKSAA